MPDDRSMVLDDQSTMLSDRSMVLDDQSMVLNDRSTMPEDQSMMPSDRSMVLDNQSMVLSDQSTMLDDRSMLPDDPSTVPRRAAPPHNAPEGRLRRRRCGFSPPEDIYEQAVVKRKTGRDRGLFKHLSGVAASDAPFHFIRCRPHSAARPHLGQVFRSGSGS